MITIIKNLPAGIIGFRYDGHVTKEDYETVMYPAFQAATEKNKELKVLCEMAESFKDFNLGVVKGDLALGLKYF
ncbi:MAG: STAS/SEC14 domain-containing protein [Bacteroidota bacterium]